jgi:hypothetical protein
MQSTRGTLLRPLLAVLLGVPALASFAGACSGGADSDFAASGASGEGGAGATTSTTGGGQGGETASTTTSSTSGTGGSMPQGCVSDAECTVDPTKPYCDLNTGKCVGCLVDNDLCPPAQYCNPTTDMCDVGCNDASDCSGGGQNLFCDQNTHACVGCILDDDCPGGSICVSQTCVPGCTPNHACQPGFSCCGSSCFDLSTNVNNCGACNAPCDDLANADVLCINSQCVLSQCQGSFQDCNGQSMDGCEQNTLNDGPCLCNPGDTQTCYQGAPGTAGVGPCKSGTQTCNVDGVSWGPCTNQVMPVSEVCGNGADDDCNGAVDDGGDVDGDGFTACNGDCCDQSGAGCGASPNLVNPGAFEVVGNGLDDDCNPATSDITPTADCSTVQKFATVTGGDLASAMDICQITTAVPLTPAQKTWGLISAAQTTVDGIALAGAGLTDAQNWQSAVMVNYGTVVTPKKGPTMGAISTGKMRDQLDVGYATPDGGYLAATTDYVTLPAGGPLGAYAAAHGGGLPGTAGCAGNCPGGSSAFDGINLQLKIRVPTNAQSFSYHFKFHSAEFPEWVCQSFNDFYLALLTTGAAGIPTDKNISFDGLGNVFSINNGFFDVCKPSGCHTCPDSTAELACTGMTTTQPCVGALGASGEGGGSKWLQTDAPIVPGETITLNLQTFDVGDAAYDTNILLDNFRWNLTPAAVSTHQ